jgi:hypothetical protein
MIVTFPFTLLRDSRVHPRFWLNETLDLTDGWCEQQPGQFPDVTISVIVHYLLGPLANLCDCSQQMSTERQRITAKAHKESNKITAL